MIAVSDISKMSFKEIKAVIDSIKESDLHDSNYINGFISDLKHDDRKNVCSLGNKLENNFYKYIKEEQRIKAMYEFDKSFGCNRFVAGVDEVGRGPLAGPIVAAAVILQDSSSEKESIIKDLNDSKKLSKEKREYLSEVIKEKALYYKIAILDSTFIDKYGIGVCNHKVFLECCNGLEKKPDLVLSDGYPIKDYLGKNKAVIKGDTKSACIAAASILAKVYRDDLMVEYSKEYPQYGFEKNAGYGTREHILAIKEYGITPIHRMSFLGGII